MLWAASEDFGERPGTMVEARPLTGRMRMDDAEQVSIAGDCTTVLESTPSRPPSKAPEDRTWDSRTGRYECDSFRTARRTGRDRQGGPIPRRLCRGAEISLGSPPGRQGANQDVCGRIRSPAVPPRRGSRARHDLQRTGRQRLVHGRGHHAAAYRERPETRRRHWAPAPTSSGGHGPCGPATSYESRAKCSRSGRRGRVPSKD